MNSNESILDNTESIMCQCEHITHVTTITGHAYLGVPAGRRRAQYVGPVCDGCADGHLADYIIGEDSNK